ncbi:EEF1A lysine methyltransferase 4 [Neopsephotus bourkii]|uniref:EEF1A lysine methyltransferase 4 n=1 Tax=Neopsephotus bourkii TaxID=309878 RepID=UPI002AA5B51C|nr:EEF1A lysine methyltransferase 4 [Neopsephotus bourkii]
MERRHTPAANRRYRQRRFWDELYRQEGAEPREWLGALSRFLPHLQPELRPADRILILGCGNSALSHDLYELGYTDVTSIDYSPACIAAMRARYACCPGLHWAVMDIRALAFPDATFDVVLEKGTLDVLMVEETDPWNVSPQATATMHRVLAEVSRVLRPGGCFISITFAQPHFRKPHYAQEAFGWSLRHVACGDGDAGTFHYFLYVMRKGQPLAPPDLALGRHLHRPPPPPDPPPPPAPPDDEDYLLAIQL